MKDEAVSKNFKKSEFVCPCCKLYNMQPFVVDKVQIIRDQFGAINIISGTRCVIHNEKVGGKPASAHLDGYAVDITCFSSVLRSKLIRLGIMNGVTGIGIKPGSVHLDWKLRPADSIWLYQAS